MTAAIASLAGTYRCIGVGIGVNQELEQYGLVALPITTIPPVYIGAKHLAPLQPHVIPVIESLADAAAKFELTGMAANAVGGAIGRLKLRSQQQARSKTTR